jgi:Protein of unknown function (DUF1091)
MIVFNDSEGISRINASGYLKADLINIVYIGDVYNQKSGHKEYDQLLFKSHINGCNVKKGAIGNFIIQTIMENYKKYTNFDIPCPQKKGFLYSTNYPIADASLIPRWLIGSRTVMVVTKLKGKFEKNKPMVDIGSFRFFCSLD